MGLTVAKRHSKYVGFGIGSWLLDFLFSCGNAAIQLESRGDYGFALSSNYIYSALGKTLKSWDIRQLTTSLDQSASAHPFSAVSASALL